jgi:methyl-accepting chemotaxis protein
VPRDGSIGKETFDQVEALLKQGRSKTEAFAQIASDSGKNAGTVAANYYRVARANGSVKPRRRRRKATTPARATTATASRRARQSSNGNGEIDRLTADLVSNVQALAKAMQAQSQEVSDLRQRLDGVRSLLK